MRLILEDAALAADWRADRRPAHRARRGASGARTHRAPAGLFALLPIDRAAAVALRERHGIYMPDSGRINIAGLTTDTVAPFVAALAPFLNG